jgi:hypothetical protein
MAELRAAHLEDLILQQESALGRGQKGAVADTAFDAALGRELHEVTQKTKQMAQRDPALGGSVRFGTIPDPTS